MELYNLIEYLSCHNSMWDDFKPSYTEINKPFRDNEPMELDPTVDWNCCQDKLNWYVIITKKVNIEGQVSWRKLREIKGCIVTHPKKEMSEFFRSQRHKADGKTT